MLFQQISRIPYTTWYHIIETLLPSGQSKVLATICNRRSVETIHQHLQNHVKTNQVVYSIDPTSIYEPNRRCSICTCSK
jgi:hypothetical protein